MKTQLLTAVAVLLLATVARGQESATATPGASAPPAAQIPFAFVPEGLLRESLAARPELRQATALVRAEHERVPQAGALQDPVLTLGIQNDGFKAIQIGTMETSFWQVMVTQPLPWPGKRDLRQGVASMGVSIAEASAGRVRLSVEAEVRRSFLELVLVRDRLLLLTKLEALWTQAEALARIRYESSGGAQSDILRAQLERNRLRQRRWSLEAEERTRLQAVNRLRGHELDEALPTAVSVAAFGLPPVQDAREALADAEQRSPELLLAHLQSERAIQQVALSKREQYPDLAVSAGIMPRGGLEPMWLASVSINLPLFSGSKQSRVVAESEARADSSKSGGEAVLQLLRLRVKERLALLGSLLESARIYRDGLLIQSQATAESTLSQYRVGRLTFASVLEAIGGVISDEDGSLQSIAAAWRVAIAAAEVSLDPAGASSAGLSGGGIPGAGASSSASSGGAPGSPAVSGGGDAAGSASGNGSMSKM